jgi:hypothetical protein
MMSSQWRPAVHCLLAAFVVLLLSGGTLASSPAAGNLSASLDSVISSKAQLNCYDPDTTTPGN